MSGTQNMQIAIEWYEHIAEDQGNTPWWLLSFRFLHGTGAAARPQSHDPSSEATSLSLPHRSGHRCGRACGGGGAQCVPMLVCDGRPAGAGSALFERPAIAPLIHPLARGHVVLVHW